MPNVRSGHINWEGWDFDYDVPDHEGLSLLNGSFKGVHYIGKFSLPAIRVKYLVDGGFLDIGSIFGTGAGPYCDQISWKLGGKHGLQKITDRGGEYIGINHFDSGGVKWLEMGVYARIGAYHLYQAWFLSNRGYILPRLWSKGLTINMNHTHHPYWRLDFDIDEADNNRVYVNEGGLWAYFVREGNDLRAPRGPMGGLTFRNWYVRNERTGHAAMIQPGWDDGEADYFSKLDVAVRLYRRSEEIHPWSYDISTSDKGELGFLNGEAVGNNDVVFWFVAHMFHEASEGGDHWHGAGPSIVCMG